MLRIKRYSNRKLYDSAARRYVTLEEIADAIRRGEDLHVSDHDSGADLTTQVMLQAFFNAEKRRSGLFPAGLLTRLLRAGERGLEDARTAAVLIFERLPAVNREIERRLDRLADLGHLSLEEAKRLKELLLDASSDSGDAGHPEEVSSDEVQSLLAELERLSQQLDNLSR
ncbi:MAG: polyhydroxyalkanoate synthesis regulator DNA-binding domain-containing protein [Chloroflexota bacterium]